MKILYVLPHCSTGGMPQYVLKLIEETTKEHHIEVVEVNNLSDEYIVQREKIKKLVPLHQLHGDQTKLPGLIEDFEVVHFQEIPETFIDISVLNKLYKKGRKYDIVVTTHSSYTDPAAIRFTADRFVLVSNWSKKRFEQVFPGICEIWEYPIETINYNKEQAKDYLGWDKSYKHVLHVGLFTPGKNQKELIEIARLCTSEKILFHFIGNQAPNFEDYWGPLMKDLPANCIIHGEVNNPEDYYKASDLFYFPSLYELNPLAVKEALSYNLPVMLRKLETYEDTYDGKVKYVDEKSALFTLKKILFKDTIDDMVVIVLAHADTEFRKLLLNNCLTAINQKIILSTNYQVEESVQLLCDYVLYTKENPLLRQEDFAKYNVSYNYWWIDENGVKNYKPFEYEHGYAVYKLIQNGINLAKILGYQHVAIINYDYEISDSKLIKDYNELIKENDIVAYTQNSNAYEGFTYSTGYFTARLDAVYPFFNKFKSLAEYYLDEQGFTILEKKFYKYCDTNNFKVYSDSIDILAQSEKINQEGVLLFSQSDKYIKNFVQKNKTYQIKPDYISRLSPSHHDDSKWTDESQYEVYKYCADFMKTNDLQTVVDVGCGSGFKLIKYLGDFKTIGTETEPCYSLLKSKYPDREWYLSGDPERSFIDNSDIKGSDVVICCDVIEHIIDPDDLIDYLLSLNAKYYIISTPCRDVLCKHPRFAATYGKFLDGPPLNECHVREWTMTEFIKYLSEKFDIVKSFYGDDQIECQYHLLKPISLIRVLVSTASFGSQLTSIWVPQFSNKYEIVFNRVSSQTETDREKAMHPRLRGKIPKMIVWEDHPGYDYYIWADSRFSILDHTAIEKLVDQCQNVDACFFKHSERSSVKNEMDFVVNAMNNNSQYLIDRYENERMKEQVESYSKDVNWKDDVLFECGIFIYSKKVVENKQYNLMKEWFYHNCIWSIQDQLSLPYLLFKFQTNYKVLSGSVYENEYFEQKEILINYIDGPFVEIKGGGGQKFHVEFVNGTNIIHSSVIGDNCWTKASRKYYTDWLIRINGEEHRMSLEGKRVLISLESKSLGDSLAWIPYVEEFRKKHKCHVICSTFLNDMFRDGYPEIEFVAPGNVVHNIVAQYRIGWYYNDDGHPDLFRNPSDFRKIPLQKTAADILGLDYEEIRPRIKLPERNTKKQVGIAIHSTCQAKYWNNPTGWQDVVNYLNDQGYDVILLSREGDGYMGNKHPQGVIELPDGSLEDVIKVMRECEFFIGIGSGLSWLAWACEVPVYLISGFSETYSEMTLDTIRIGAPQGACSGCFNRYRLDAGDWNWCPDYKNTPRQFECSRLISGKMIINHLKINH